MVENLCRKAGCIPPSCCHGDREQPLVIKGSSNNLNVFPDALPYSEMEARLAEDPNGAYVFYWEPDSILEMSDYMTFIVIGACPNEKENGDCSVYEDPNRPRACDYNKIGGEFCTNCRALDGLPPALIKIE